MGLRGRRGRGFLIAAGLVGSSVLVAGCGGSPKVSVRTLQHAAKATAATGLQMNISLNETVGGPSVVFTATGSFTPKKNQGTMTMTMQEPPAGGGGTTPMQVVIANGTIYEQLPPQLASRIPGRRPWLSLKLNQLSALNQLPGLYDFIRASLTFDDPSQYLDFLSAAAAGSVKKLGQTSISGVRTTHYKTAIEISKLPTAATSTARPAATQLAHVLKSRLGAATMPVEVWIDRSNRIRRLQASLQGSTLGHTVSVAITENITGYGSQPAPTVPSAAETTNLLSLVHGFQASSG